MHVCQRQLRSRHDGGSAAATSAPAAALIIGGRRESVCQQAMKEESISAEAVRAEYNGYVCYLGGTGSLTQADRQYLKDNQIMVPDDLNKANQAGLHNVINDTSPSPDARRAAVNNFLSRAVEAELYCGFNSCADAKGPTTGA